MAEEFAVLSFLFWFYVNYGICCNWFMFMKVSILFFIIIITLLRVDIENITSFSSYMAELDPYFWVDWNQVIISLRFRLILSHST